jgi:hypothetical protein
MKKALSIILCVFVLAGGVLVVHVYLETGHRMGGAGLVMARIDLHQPIGRTDADSISAWLYRQKGVSHVVVNSQRAIALFTFAPAKNNANGIVRAFKASMPYGRAERYLPSAEIMKSGCPVMH